MPNPENALRGERCPHLSIGAACGKQVAAAAEPAAGSDDALDSQHATSIAAVVRRPATDSLSVDAAALRATGRERTRRQTARRTGPPDRSTLASPPSQNEGDLRRNSHRRPVRRRSDAIVLRFGRRGSGGEGREGRVRRAAVNRERGLGDGQQTGRTDSGCGGDGRRPAASPLPQRRYSPRRRYSPNVATPPAWPTPARRYRRS